MIGAQTWKYVIQSKKTIITKNSCIQKLHSYAFKFYTQNLIQINNIFNQWTQHLKWYWTTFSSQVFIIIELLTNWNTHKVNLRKVKRHKKGQVMMNICIMPCCKIKNSTNVVRQRMFTTNQRITCVTWKGKVLRKVDLFNIIGFSWKSQACPQKASNLS